MPRRSFDRPFLHCAAVSGLALLWIGCLRSSASDLNASRASAGEVCSFSELARSPDEVEFTEVVGLDVDSRGRMYVGDRLKANVTVLDNDGALLKTVGRKGEGPGEFRDIRNVQVLPGDSLMVFDFGLYRLTVFAPGPGEVAYVRNLAASALTPPNWVAAMPEQHLLFATHRRPFAAGADPKDDSGRLQAARILAWDGTLRRDSVVVAPAPKPVIAREGRSVAVTPDPFAPADLLRPGPGGRIFFGEGDSLAVAVFSLEGKRTGGFSLPHQPPPVTEKDIEAAAEGTDEILRKAVREQAPEYWPSFRTMLVDDEARIWLGLLTPRGEPTRWAAFDQSGKRLCSGALPENVDLKLVRGDRAYGVATDELGVPRIVIYRLERGQ